MRTNPARLITGVCLSVFAVAGCAQRDCPPPIPPQIPPRDFAACFAKRITKDPGHIVLTCPAGGVDTMPIADP